MIKCSILGLNHYQTHFSLFYHHALPRIPPSTFFPKIIHLSRFFSSRSLSLLPWHEVIFSFTRSSHWIFIMCQELCLENYIFFHCTLNPYNSPMKYRPLLLLVYRKGNWGTIGMIKSNNATNWTKHFSCVTILSTQRAHLIGTLPIISTWLTRKLRFRGVILPKFPQRWEDSDKLSLLTLEPHELSNEGEDFSRITSTTGRAKVPADLKVRNSSPILDHLPLPWLFIQTTHLGLSIVIKWHVCSCVLLL